jgi:hypothetical protein
MAIALLYTEDSCNSTSEFNENEILEDTFDLLTDNE